MATTTIGVIGKNEQTVSDHIMPEAIAAAEEVGRLIARRGGVTVTGGLKGIMEAACKGAKSAGGLTVGFLPLMDPETANAYLDLVFPTGLGRARNLLTARCCDALIMIGGSCGTLNEVTIAYAEARPIIVIEGTGGWSDKLRVALYEERYLDDRRTIEIEFVRSPSDAVDRAFALAKAPRRASQPVNT